MLTEAGTFSADGALELSVTVVEAVAAPLSDTVQATLPPALTLPAPQVMPLRLTLTGATTFSETLFVIPFSAALSVTFVFADTVPAVAVKLALEPPAAMLTEAGTFSADGALELSVTVVEAVAAPLSDTVQATLPPALTLARAASDSTEAYADWRNHGF